MSWTNTRARLATEFRMAAAAGRPPDARRVAELLQDTAGDRQDLDDTIPRALAHLGQDTSIRELLAAVGTMLRPCP